MTDNLRVLPREEDLVERIRRLIDDDKIDEAIDVILSLDRVADKLRTLVFLIHDVSRDLSYYDRTLAVTRALALPRALAHERALALSRALSRALAYGLDLSRALSRARDLDLALALSHDLDLAVESAKAKNDIVIVVLREMLGQQTFSLTGVDLTPTTLLHDIAPYVNAMSAIQEVLSELQGKEFKQPKIISITSGSAVFSITGFLGLLTPLINWLRFGKKQVEAMDLQNQYQRLLNDNQIIVNQSAQIELKTAKEKYLIDNDPALTEIKRQAKREDIEIERQQKQLELRKAKLKIEEQEMALAERRFQLAQKLASEFLYPYFPEDMPMHERAEFIVRAIPHLQTILDSRLTLKPDRPRTLPEETDDD